MLKYQRQLALASMMLVFATVFIGNTRSDLPLIFEKDLRAHDEASNSVVVANVTRKFFPPMVRVNPLNEEQGNWMEGPYWQHIPPLFAYVPYLFFTIDGQVTIEMKRLAFAFVTLLTGLLFIFVVYRFRKSLWAALAATLAAITWVNMPFTHELITGYAFGVSDIVLAFTVVASFCAILWYLNSDKREVISGKLIVLGAIVALPIMAKNLLGAIPAATLLGLMLYDRWKGKERSGKNLIFGALGFIFALILYYLPLYFASPETFKQEIIVSFLHFTSLEGWARPWHWHITNYLPDRYLFGWTWVFYLGLILAAGVGYRVWGTGDRKDKILLVLSGGWFIWNLVAISLVTSKVPNFIYQSMLLSIFFIIYSLILLIKIHPGISHVGNNLWRNVRDLGEIPDPPALPVRRAGRDTVDKTIVAFGMVIGLGIIILTLGFESARFVRAFDHYRSSAYNYQTENEKFYQVAEQFHQMGVDQNDLIIYRIGDNDCWIRYYTLYLTGAESKTLLEMYFSEIPYEKIKEKYQKMFVVINKQDALPEVGDYSYLEFDLTKMSAEQIESAIQAYLKIHDQDIEQDILRIKKDKMSCQWQVPDPILNAP